MRQIQTVLIVAGVTIGMFGCKSNSSSPSSSPVSSTPIAQPQLASVTPLPATKPDNRPVLVCFGDSLTAGYGADPGQSYPDYLQADLDARGYHYRVVNEGISGNTTKDGVERLGTILALKPTVIVVELGGNDGLRGLPIEDSRANLDKIITTLKASGAKIALAGITLPPDYGPDYIKQFDETYTLLAKKHHIPMLPFLLQGVYGVNGMMQTDQTHATAAGNEIIAKNVLPLVLPLLKKKQP
ncbi:arylesterase [Edaphobacter paludis]|uniref:Arylesterase n=1 Tax=Edaphobacter paludis TaxID=3035702 RepID=A0AAU7D5A3_9BACT